MVVGGPGSVYKPTIKKASATSSGYVKKSTVGGGSYNVKKVVGGGATSIL
jgi:hypothetical protein